MADINHIKNDLGFILNPTKEAVAEFVAKAKTAMSKLNYSSTYNVVVGGQCQSDGEHYMVVARLRNTLVNKNLVSPYESDFEKDYGQFPKWGAICIKRREPEKLYFGVFYETCSPNWNHESKVLKLIPLDDISEPIVTDLDKGVSRVAPSVIDALFNARQKRIGEDLPNYGEQPSKEQLRHLIELGMLCTFRKGWAYRGAADTPITKERALELLAKHSYGKGFYTMTYSVKDNVPKLEFNELSELDME